MNDNDTARWGWTRTCPLSDKEYRQSATTTIDTSVFLLLFANWRWHWHWVQLIRSLPANWLTGIFDGYLHPPPEWSTRSCQSNPSVHSFIWLTHIHNRVIPLQNPIFVSVVVGTAYDNNMFVVLILRECESLSTVVTGNQQTHTHTEKSVCFGTIK